VNRLEGDYYDYMQFDSAHARDVLSFYIPFFEGAEKILELASGRGEFLGLAREAGIQADGVDWDEHMVETARERGFQVALGDAIEYAAKWVEADSYDGVFTAHFLEHLQPEQVAALLASVHRILRPGARFVAVVPNPACYSVLTHDFWRDPTHVRFYDVPLLGFLCTQAGLTMEASGGNPRNLPGPPPEVIAATEPPVHPLLGEAIDQMLEGIYGLDHKKLRYTLRRRLTHRWQHRAAHLIRLLDERLQSTQSSLRTLHSAYVQLLGIMYQANEVYVVARK
jgi:SAM-dependent methyltransferase